MKVHQAHLSLPSRSRGLHPITREIADVVAASGITTGLCTVFVQHTSASLVIQENADPAVLRDLDAWMGRLAPEAFDYEHADEGPDDMPAHLRASVTKTSETIPVTEGRLALGTWQGLYLFEHRRRAHARRVVVHVAGV